MSQIKKKFIGDNEVDGSKIRLENDQYIRSRNAADSADVNIIKVNGTDGIEMGGELSMANNKIIDVTDPTAAQDAATKAYVDSVVGGVTDPKDAARAATTAALPAVTYDNGTAGVGATLTADANGALGSIDGISLAVSDRLLVKDQVSGLENGIYTVTQLGDGSNPFILTRSTDFDESPTEVNQGALVPVAEGSLNGGLGFILTTPDPIVMGTTPLTFTQFGQNLQAGQGIDITGSVVSTDNGDGLGYSGNSNVVVTDIADGDPDATTKIDGSARVASRKSYKETFTLVAQDITNQYVDLARVASRDSIQVLPACGPLQPEGVDYSVSYTGGTGGFTRVSFLGDLATGGGAALVATDVLYISYDSMASS